MPSKIALVVQRYGADVLGGAELHAREIAERLQADSRYQVDVYTTTAKDYMTWRNFFPKGHEVQSGINIFRYSSIIARWRYFGAYDRISAPLMRKFKQYRITIPLVLLLEIIWIILQGPFCPSLIRALAKKNHEYKKIIFFTYLYYPTLAGIRKFGDKSILIPLAHNEHPFHFLVVRKMLNSVRSIIANTIPEISLLKSKIVDQNKLIDQAGVGFDSKAYTSNSYKSSEEPYILYLGRISTGKGVGQLLDWFRHMTSSKEFAGLKLKLAGHLESSITLNDDPRIEYLGFVDNPTKLNLIRNSVALINPSQHESLSLIVIEAMASRIPVLVNQNCEVLRHYTEVCPTVFGFCDLRTFTESVNRVLNTPWESEPYATDLDKSRNWALETFSWDRILNIYEKHFDY